MAAGDEAGAPGVRAELRSWLEANWDPDMSLRDWRAVLVDSGWGCPTWPAEWFGRGLSGREAGAVTEEFHRVGAVGAATGVGMSLAAPTILAHGSDELKGRFLRPTATGEYKWCQLFSEPGSGSDLAGLTTRADRDGDEWIVNGQKVWNSGAHQAHYGILLARTDWSVPKHRGISYFLIDMLQAGVEARPLRMMNDHASFNEVFLTDARVPHDNLVGLAGEGWAAAMTTLAHERGIATGRRARFPKDLDGRAIREAKAEADDYYATYRWYPQRAGRPDLVEPEAVKTGRANDPLLRQEMMRLRSLRSTAEWSARRGQAARAAGRPPGPEGSLAKLNSSAIARASALAHTHIQGADAMLTGPGTAAGGLIAEVLVSTPAMSIAGGTDEIQHNIIGERVLGLPREPGDDRDLPFRELRSNDRAPRG